jgi:hypothetical protein
VTIDVIHAARRRTRQRLLVAALIPTGFAVLAYPLLASTPTAAVHTAPAATTTAAPAAAPSTPATGAGSRQGGLLPADVSWTRVAGVDLPASATTGPARVEGGLASGFAHTCAGGVVAALHLLVRTSAQVGPAVFSPTIRDQVVGADAAAMLTTVTATYEQAAAASGVDAGQPLPDLSARFGGARIDSCTPATCDLSVLTTAVDVTGTARFAVTTVHLRWTGEDWALLAPPGGRWDSQVLLVTADTAAAFTPLHP